MSGHSKWSTIKRKKGALDAKRGKLFTKLIKEISIAAKEGGSADPDANPRLRLAVQNAKGNNMPKDNIERALKKAAGGDDASYLELTYEGYAPNGVAVYVECLTDNQNRTVANVRAAFNKFEGSLGKNGSIEFLFDRKGVFTVQKTEGLDLEEFELAMIEAGAEELEVDEEYITIFCAMEDFGGVQKGLDDLSVEIENAELQRIPTTSVKLEDEDFVRVMKLIEYLEDDDDIQKVYHNLEVQDHQMELV